MMIAKRRTAVIIFLMILGCFALNDGNRHTFHVAIEKAQVLHSLRHFDVAEVSSPANWDSGWQRLCEKNSGPQVYTPSNSDASIVATIIAISAGDFEAAGELLAREEVRTTYPGGWAYYLALQGDWIGSAEAYEREPILRDARFWGTVFFLAGQRAFDAGDSETADRMLVKAETLYSQYGPFSSPSLAKCLELWGKPEESQRELRRSAAVIPPGGVGDKALAGFLPPESSAVAVDWLPLNAVRPSYPVSTTVAADWMLMGLDVNQDDLEESPLLRVTLYWHTRTQPDRAARVYTVVRNLVANGALEWDYAPQRVRPFGYFETVYPEFPKVSLEREAVHHNVLCVAPPLPEEPSGLQGLVFPLSTSGGTTLVQGGDVVSREEGGFALGRRWYGDSARYPYSYVDSGKAPADWQSFVGSVTLNAGVHSVALWVLNSGKGGKTCFDNLFLFELPSPPVAD